jgi:hypothetical protein
MLDPIFPILFLLFISLGMSALVAGLSWRRRDVPSAPQLFFTAVAAVTYTFSTGWKSPRPASTAQSSG